MPQVDTLLSIDFQRKPMSLANPLKSRRQKLLRIERLEMRQLLTVEISEFLASNQTTGFADEDGESTDWIELYNSGPNEVDLSGWHLTDDPEQLSRWTFPSHQLSSEQYIVVFASGKDRATSGSELHTNFKLSRNGEYLALVQPDGKTINTQYGTADTDYPEQISDVSYGPSETVDPVQSGIFYMPEPTPGAANGPGVLGFIDDTQFDVDRGFYSEVDSSPGGVLANGVTITALAPENVEAQIYYTTDGSNPAPDNPNATFYTQPIQITSTTTLRAIAVADRYIPSNVDTHTYLFVNNVLAQDGAGLPELTRMDYEMDPDIVNDPRFANLADDLKSLPTVSFVGAIEDLFGRRGIIENPTRLGRDWEREVSVELLNPDGSDGFQENAGLRIQGAGSRARSFSKKGFQLFFRGEYGANQLEFPFFGEERADSIDRIAFRGNFFDSWTFDRPGRIGGACCGYNQALLLRDQFGHETHEDMGSLAIAGNWVHLYLNGQYWGLYNAIERPDEQFAEHYLGGNSENYDVLKQRPRGQGDGAPPEVVHGDRKAWNELIQLVRGDIETDEVYRQVQNVLDVGQFADYILLNIFGGNFDWPHNNWYGMREKTEDGKWIFVSWDTENFIFDVNADRTSFSTNNSPGIIYSRLRRNAEFRLLFADRVHEHMFNNGALTPQENIERFQAIVDGMTAAMNAESARWGDAIARSPRNTIDTWLPVVNEKVNHYFPQRTAIVLDQLLDRDLYTPVEAPEFYVNGQRQHGGAISTESKIKIGRPLSTFANTVLIEEGAPVTAYIPGEGQFANSNWTQPGFDTGADPFWSAGAISGTTGVGYGEDYLERIGTDVSTMEDNSGSVLTRIEFSLDHNTSFGRLQLHLLYDDAFVAYLNGVEVARSSNIRDQLPPQAARARNHRADEFEVFDISGFKHLLKDGQNVLAVQAINVSKGSNDLLMVPRLVGGILDLSVIDDSIWLTIDGTDPRDQATNAPSAAARQFSGDLLFNESTTINARAFVDGVWSALTQATFEIQRTGDLNEDGVVDASDIDFLTAGIRQNNLTLDFTGDGAVDQQDLAYFVQTTLETNFGDSNLDGTFDSGDLVHVFQLGEYEDNIPQNSTWADGDWDGSGDFDTGDLVLAFQAGGFSAAANRTAVSGVGHKVVAMKSKRLEDSDDRSHHTSCDRNVNFIDLGKNDGGKSQAAMVDLYFADQVATRNHRANSSCFDDDLIIHAKISDIALEPDL